MVEADSNFARNGQLHLCLLCGRTGEQVYTNLRDVLFHVPGEWSMKTCRRCGLFWLSPQPSLDDLPSLYRNYHTHRLHDASLISLLVDGLVSTVAITSLGYSSPNAGPARSLLVRLAKWIGPLRGNAELSLMCLRFIPGGTLLDVGCGSGRFLAKMKALGWEVQGVEPDEMAVRFARERFGLDVKQGTLEAIGFPEGRFDAVTLGHVIEHVRDPAALVRECRRVTKTGGMLVITTPNAESLAHRVFRAKWRGLEPPRHLYVFSPRALRQLVEKEGWHVKSVWTSSRSARGIFVSSMFPDWEARIRKPAARYLAHALGALFSLCEWGLQGIGVGNLGEEIVLIAEKRGSGL